MWIPINQHWISRSLFQNEQLLSASDITPRKKASKWLREAFYRQKAKWLLLRGCGFFLLFLSFLFSPVVVQSRINLNTGCPESPLTTLNLKVRLQNQMHVWKLEACTFFDTKHCQIWYQNYSFKNYTNSVHRSPKFHIFSYWNVLTEGSVLHH